MPMFCGNFLISQKTFAPVLRTPLTASAKPTFRTCSLPANQLTNCHPDQVIGLALPIRSRVEGPAVPARAAVILDTGKLRSEKQLPRFHNSVRVADGIASLGMTVGGSSQIKKGAISRRPHFCNLTPLVPYSIQERPQLEAFCGRERSGSPQPKSRAEPRDLVP